MLLGLLSSLDLLFHEPDIPLDDGFNPMHQLQPCLNLAAAHQLEPQGQYLHPQELAPPQPPIQN